MAAIHYFIGAIGIAIIRKSDNRTITVYNGAERYLPR